MAEDVYLDRVDLYDYHLPEELIAQAPAEKRSGSKLMVLQQDKSAEHRIFADIVEYFRPGDVLVRNTTRVFPARLIGRRSGGGRTEVLLVRNISGMKWECLARPCSHLKSGKIVSFGESDELKAEILEKLGGGRVIVELHLDEGCEFWPTIERIGQTPLPPYIAREGTPGEEDVKRYQTVYAGERGAVAAPTAGLHFTPELFAELEKKGVEIRDVVLHVGPGTFRPVKAELISEHQMDVEHYRIPQETADAVNAAKAEGRRVVAVGTTSTRALESAADAPGHLCEGEGSTDIFIYPPYKFKIIDGLVTNFHLPRSTLLMLVSSLAGRERMLSAYAEAVAKKYRFYSYGDAMIILPAAMPQP